MPSAEEQTDQSGEPVKTDKDYVDIIRSDIEPDKKYIEETGVPTKIIYYCQDCKKIIKPKRIGKKFRFSCPECKGDNVAFGSEKSIKTYYKIPSAEPEPEKKD